MARLDGNGLRAPKPNEELAKSIQGAIKRGHNRYLKNGKVIVLRYKSRAKERFGILYEEEPLDMRNANRGSDARRAAINEQTLTEQDYLDYAKRNGYSSEQAVELYQQNENRLNKLRGQKSAKLHYEHLLPTRSPMRGGVEHYRNVVMMGNLENLEKSDKLASIPAAREAGVPLTKQGALFADFNQLPLPTDQRRVDIILSDIANQSAPKTTRDVRSALQQSNLAEPVGQKFKFTGRNASLAQTALTSSILQKAQQIQPDLNTLRRTATAAAVGGAALPAFLGSAASASELATRKAIQAQTGSAIDKLQTGIAGASLAADTASYVPVLAVPAGIASAGLDIVNAGIDVSRNLIEEAKKNQLLQNIYNTFH